jgi:hypothetical protein
MGAEVRRGPWHYDGEIDLGFGGALRMAATVVTRDPVFDWIAYGGVLGVTNEALSVIPRDGLRQRLCVIVDGTKDSAGNIQRLKIQLDRDGFAAEKPICLDKRLGKISFTLENRTGDRHSTGLWLSAPTGASYSLAQDGKSVPFRPTGNWDYPLRADLDVGTKPVVVEMVRAAARQ